MSNRRTLALALPLALVAPAGCSPDSGEDVGVATSAIEGGALDGHDSGVVAVIVADASGDPSRMCSGALIGERLVLTAQHCIADTGRRVRCESSSFGPPLPAARIRVTSSPRLWTRDTAWVDVTEVITPPGEPRVCGRDVALLALRQAPSAPPLVPRLDASVEIDEPYAAVGFGVTGGEDDDAGLRRRRDRLRVLCVGDGCETREIAGDEWRGDLGACDGDSGGPALDVGGGVIGVTSRGPAGCLRPIYGALAPHAGWIREAAARVAVEGRYRAPGWAEESPEPPPGGPPLVVAGGGGCSFASAPAPFSGLVATAAAAVALALRRRRRAAGARV